MSRSLPPGMAEHPVECPACLHPMRLKPSRFGYFYGCSNWPTCDVTHGAHPDGRPLGRPPKNDAEKRARMRAHDAFDPLWKTADQMACYADVDDASRRRIRSIARKRAYRWLQHQLHMTKDECHIGMFGVPECDQLIKVCSNMTPAAVRDWYKKMQAEGKLNAPRKHKPRTTERRRQA